MTVLVDANVVLDVMLGREPFLADSASVLAAVETSRCQGMLCASTVTTIHYIARRHLGTVESLAVISKLMSIFEIAPVNRSVLSAALGSTFSDFEDSVLHESALQAGASCIVTRNVADFRNANALIYTPSQFLEALAAENRVS